MSKNLPLQLTDRMAQPLDWYTVTRTPTRVATADWQRRLRNDFVLGKEDLVEMQ